MFALLASAWLFTAQAATGPDVLAEVGQVPTFLDEYRVVARTDRVAIIRTRDGRRSVVGTGSPLGKPSSAFVGYLAENVELSRALGPPLSVLQSGLDGAIEFQVFDGGLIAKEAATGTIWPLTHARRHARPRPADEIVRHPSFGLFSKEYDFTAFRDRIEIRDIAVGRIESVRVSAGRYDIGPAAARAFEKNAALRDRLVAAVSPETSLFSGELSAQVFLGGVVLYEPATKRTWYAWHARRGIAVDDSGPAVSLPFDPTAEVIAFDWRGGFTPPRLNDAPYFTIRADGLATLVEPFGKRPTIQTRYSRQQLLDLLGFIVHQQRFFDLDSGRLKDEIRKGPRILDAGTSVIRVSTANRTHEVRCYAAAPYAEALPNAADVQRFVAIERRLEREMDRIRHSAR